MKLRTFITNTIGVLVILGLAGGLSLVALAKPSLQWQKEEAPAPVVETPAVVAPAPVVEQPAAAPVVEAPVTKTAVTVSFVRLRAGKSTTTDVLAELQANTTVNLLDDQNSLWQGVQYGNIKGYIYKSYLKY